MATLTWISWFPWIVIDFTVDVKSLKKGVLDTMFFKFSWLLLLLCWIVSYILLFTTSQIIWVSNPVQDLKILHMLVSHMFLSQWKQNSILYYDTLYVIIQGGHQSGLWQPGKVRKKKSIFKVIQRNSENVRKSQKTSGRAFWKVQGKINIK